MAKRRTEEPDAIERLGEEVANLSQEIQVLRETLDEIREYLQWITRNPDQFQVVVAAKQEPEAKTEGEEEPTDDDKLEPAKEPKIGVQSLFE